MKILPLLVLLLLPARLAVAGAMLYHVAFSANMFTDVNENDVRAAMKVWIASMSREINIPVDQDMIIFNSAEEFAATGDLEHIDGISLTVPEYPALARRYPCDRFVAGVRNGLYTEEYLLLIRRSSGVQRLEQLREGRLAVVRGSRMGMGQIWLDTLLGDQGQRRVTDFFRRIDWSRKADQVVLPLFFGKVDACLVTRTSFDILCELNPQLRQQLMPLAVSPPLVPAGFAYSSTRSSTFSAHVVEATKRLADTPAGRQLLLLTQCEEVEAYPISCLDSSLALLDKHTRMFGAAKTRTKAAQP